MKPMNSPAELHRRIECWVREHGAAVRGYLLGNVRRHDIADDLLQEVFRKAFSAGENYTEQGSARSYLLRIADRLLCDRFRKASPEINVGEASWQVIEPLIEDSEPDLETIAAESRQALMQALDQLSPDQRRVLLLRYYSDMSFAQVAEAMDCPLNTVLSHCRRGLQGLRKILSSDSP